MSRNALDIDALVLDLSHVADHSVWIRGEYWHVRCSPVLLPGMTSRPSEEMLLGAFPNVIQSVPGTGYAALHGLCSMRKAVRGPDADDGCVFAALQGEPQSASPRAAATGCLAAQVPGLPARHPGSSSFIATWCVQAASSRELPERTASCGIGAVCLLLGSSARGRPPIEALGWDLALVQRWRVVFPRGLHSQSSGTQQSQSDRKPRPVATRR